MKQKISGPVAIVIVVVIVALLFGGLYRKYMYQPTYSIQDVAAKYRAAAAKMGKPPNVKSDVKQ